MDCTLTRIVLLLKKQIRYVMHLFLHGSLCHCQYKTTLTLLLLVSLLLFSRQKQVITRLGQELLQMEGKLHGTINGTESYGIEEKNYN